MHEAFVAEPLLRAMAGTRLVLFAVLFLVASPLRCRAWACVLVLLQDRVLCAFPVFGGLVLFKTATSWASRSS